LGEPQRGKSQKDAAQELIKDNCAYCFNVFRLLLPVCPWGRLKDILKNKEAEIHAKEETRTTIPHFFLKSLPSSSGRILVTLISIELLLPIIAGISYLRNLGLHG